MAATYRVDVRRYFPETSKVNSKGKPIHMVVTVRKMYLYGDFIGTRQYSITRVSRKGTGVHYCFYYLPESKRELFPMPKLRPDPEPEWKAGDRMNQRQFTVYLSRVLGASEATDAFLELETASPTRDEE